MSSTHRTLRSQHGMALITSLLLLIIITLLAMSMFRSFSTQEKIAGNLREKERALHAAESAQQFGEAWLVTGSNSANSGVPCIAGLLNGRLGQGQLCSNRLDRDLLINPATVPWLIGGNPANPVGVTYQPTGMSVTSGVNGAQGVGDAPYFGVPTFYIADLGTAADAQGEAYKIDAFGYGGTAGTVAVVESTYEVQQGVVNRGGL